MNMLKINWCTIQLHPLHPTHHAHQHPTWLGVWTQSGQSQSLFIHHTVASKGQLLSGLNNLQRRWHFRELSDECVDAAEVFPFKTNTVESQQDARSLPFTVRHVRRFSTAFSSSSLVFFYLFLPSSHPPPLSSDPQRNLYWWAKCFRPPCPADLWEPACYWLATGLHIKHTAATLCIN